MKAMLLPKAMLLTSAALLLASPVLADKMVSNPLTPSEYKARVLTLDEKYAALRQQRENELAALESRITHAREELRETSNRNNGRKIWAGLPAEIDSAPQEVKLTMERGTLRVWPAPRPFTSVTVGSEELEAKPGDAGNVDLVISAQKKGYGNIILTDEQGKVIADIQVDVVDTKEREKKGSDPVPLGNLTVQVPPSNGDGK